jgi:uncharacterized membrane protein YdjX (TVP38/TMEM64 family)
VLSRNFFISAWALWKALAWLGRRLKQRFDEKAIRSGSRFNRLILERVRPVLMTLSNFVAAITLLSAFSFVISYTLGLFPQTAGISTTLLDYLGDLLKRVGTAIVEYLPSGGIVVVTVLIAHYVLKVMKFFGTNIRNAI